MAACCIGNEDRKSIAPIALGLTDAKPEGDLPHHPQIGPPLGQQPARPRPRREYQPAGSVTPPVCLHGNATAVCLPGDDGLLRVDVGSQLCRLLDMAAHAVLHKQKARRALQHRLDIVAKAEGGEALPQLGRRHRFHRQLVQRRRLEHTGNQRIADWSDAQAGALRQQVPALALLQVVPAPVGPVQQWHIIGMFVIGLADDAREAVRAAAVVDQRMLLQSQHAPAAPGQLKYRSRAHAAHTNHNDIVAACVHGFTHHTVSGPYPRWCDLFGCRPPWRVQSVCSVGPEVGSAFFACPVCQLFRKWQTTFLLFL